MIRNKIEYLPLNDRKRSQNCKGTQIKIHEKRPKLKKLLYYDKIKINFIFYSKKSNKIEVDFSLNQTKSILFDFLE